MKQPKAWIKEKNLSIEELRAVNCGCATYSIDRETEKAVHFVIDTDFGKIYMWCPKSQVIDDEVYTINGQTFTEDEMDEEGMNEYYKELDNKFNNAWEKGLAYNVKLLEYAKANHVKGVRKGLRTATLIAKIQASGLEVPSRA